MTTTADIVIIGGGVQGASLAFGLAERKVGKVVLLEKNWLAAGPTSKSGTMIRPLFVDRVYGELVLASTAMFECWADVVGGDSGFVQNGFLRIAKSLDAQEIGADLDLMRSLGAKIEILSTQELRALVPSATFTDGEQGILLPKGGYADPVKTTTSLARAAARRGVEIREGVGVTGIEVKDGAVVAVATTAGRIAAPLVVNCAGSWSGRVAAMVGVELPILVQRVQTGLFRRPETVSGTGPTFSDGTYRVYHRPFDQNTLRVGHFGWTLDPADPDDWDETLSREKLAEMREHLDPRSEAIRRTTSFGGFSALYDCTPDGHPIVGPTGPAGGFWCNCGWSGNGFAPAPAAGRAIAQRIVEGRSDIDLSGFSWPRPVGVGGRADMKWTHR